MAGIDVSDELKDLMKVYTDAEQHLIKKEKDALDQWTLYSRRYIDISDERKKVTEKLSTLKAKMDYSNKAACCNDDEDEDEDDR